MENHTEHIVKDWQTWTPELEITNLPSVVLHEMWTWFSLCYVSLLFGIDRFYRFTHIFQGYFSGAMISPGGNPRTTEVTLNTWVKRSFESTKNSLYNHNKTKHNKTVYILCGIYCIACSLLQIYENWFVGYQYIRWQQYWDSFMNLASSIELEYIIHILFVRKIAYDKWT